MAEFKVLCLGSQDMVPIKGNDCSHYLINGHILVDCGTSPVMNLLNAGVDLGFIDRIIFTHTHPDHCVGLASLLYYLRDVKKFKLTYFEITGPVGTIDAVRRALSPAVSGVDVDENMPKVTELGGDGSFTVHEKDGEITVRYTEALHAVPALCYRFEKNGKVLCFTGDTYPLDKLPAFFADTDALVHETSFGRPLSGEDEKMLDDLKRACGHCSPFDAANVAAAANAKRVYLTHARNDHEDRVKAFSEKSDIPVSFIEFGVTFEV